MNRNEAEARALSSLLTALTERRKALALRQTDAADLVGKDRSYISRLEAGSVADVGFVELSRIAAAYGSEADVFANRFLEEIRASKSAVQDH